MQLVRTYLAHTCEHFNNFEFFTAIEITQKSSDELPNDQPVDASAFHPPGGGAVVNSYNAPTYPSQNSYQNTYSSNTNSNYHLAPSSSSDNYQYRNSSYPNTHPSYHYPTPAPENYDPNYSTYQQGYGAVNYNQLPPTNSYPPAPNPDPLVQTPFTASTSSYEQWNYNN